MNEFKHFFKFLSIPSALAGKGTVTEQYYRWYKVLTISEG